MFYFEDLDLDCDDGHLGFYTGESKDTRVAGLEGDICGDDKPQGVFTVDDRYLQIQYVPKRSQNISDIFSIIITIYGDGYCIRHAHAHKCANSRCIYGELACNGYDSCGDCSYCDHLTTVEIIGIVIGCVVGLWCVFSPVTCCICSKGRSGTTEIVHSTATPTVTYSGRNQQQHSQPMYRVNQGSPYNPNPPPYHVATAPRIAATASGQQGSSHPTDNEQYNVPPPQYSEIFQISEPGTNQPVPPPQYSEIFQNSEPGTNQHVPPPQYSEIFQNSEPGTHQHIA